MYLLIEINAASKPDAHIFDLNPSQWIGTITVSGYSD
jgi:hypothetical protein